LAKKKKKTEWRQIGVVGVDSGQVLLCDPCYLDSQWRRSRKNEILEVHDVKHAGEFSYRGCGSMTLRPPGGGQLNYRMGHAGAGVVSKTMFGDGCYPVFALYENGKGPLGLLIDFEISDYGDGKVTKMDELMKQLKKKVRAGKGRV